MRTPGPRWTSTCDEVLNALTCSPATFQVAGQESAQCFFKNDGFADGFSIKPDMLCKPDPLIGIRRVRKQEALAKMGHAERD